MISNLLILTVFPLCMALAAAMDLFTLTIPNKISLVLIAGFVVVAYMLGLTWATIGWHIVTFLLALAIGFILFARNLLGAGDAKVYASVALWFGIENLFALSFTMSIFGGILALLLLKFRSVVLPSFWGKQAWLVRLQKNGLHMPYGIAIAAAALIIYPNTEIFKSVVLP